MSVVASGYEEVGFVAALRAQLHFPQPPLRIEIDAQQVAVAQRPDLRRHAALVGEGVVGRLAAVVVEAHQLAEVGLHVLRGIELLRSEEHTSELQSLMRISYAVFCLKKKHRTPYENTELLPRTQ